MKIIFWMNTTCISHGSIPTVFSFKLMGSGFSLRRSEKGRGCKAPPLPATDPFKKKPVPFQDLRTQVPSRKPDTDWKAVDPPASVRNQHPPMEGFFLRIEKLVGVDQVDDRFTGEPRFPVQQRKQQFHESHAKNPQRGRYEGDQDGRYGHLQYLQRAAAVGRTI